MSDMEAQKSLRRRWAYAHISPSLMNQVDYATKTLTSYGKPKFEGKREFIESAIIEKLKREGVKEVAAQ